MKRVNQNNRAQIDKFGSGKHGFQGGNPAAGVLPTIPGADWFNHTQEEICNVIEKSGLTLNPGEYDQLYKAIKKLFASSVVNSLSSTNIDKPLSAAQGKKLNDDKLDKTALKFYRAPVLSGSQAVTLDLTNRQSIIDNFGDKYIGYGHLQLVLHNSQDNHNISGLPLRNHKSPVQLDFYLMGGFTLIDCHYIYLNRTFRTRANWNNETFTLEWKENLNEDNGVMLTGDQSIAGKKTFAAVTDFSRGLRISGSGQDQWFQLGFSTVAAFLKNPVSNKELRLGNDGVLNYQGDKIMLASDKSDAVNLDNTNKLATAKAVKIVNDKIERAAPSGTVVYFSGHNAPAGWLKANGAAVSRTIYADLFAVIGTTYGAGDGRTTFNLPDIRGEFVRGWDDGRNIDRGRALGSNQSDNIAEHRHATGWRAGSRGNEFVLLRSAWSGQSNITADVVAKGGAQIPGHDEHYVHVSGSTYANSNDTYATSSTYYDKQGETYPRNVALLACIKI